MSAIIESSWKVLEFYIATKVGTPPALCWLPGKHTAISVMASLQDDIIHSVRAAVMLWQFPYWHWWFCSSSNPVMYFAASTNCWFRLYKYLPRLISAVVCCYFWRFGIFWSHLDVTAVKNLSYCEEVVRISLTCLVSIKVAVVAEMSASWKIKVVVC